MRPRCAMSRSACDGTAATGRCGASPGDIARRPRRPRTARSRAMRPRTFVIERPHLRLQMDSAHHAGRAEHRTTAAAHTSRHYQPALSRPPAGIHTS